ncbi:Protein of uncharacterised function (DUF1469) [Actinomyces bovis]|uniref:Protein of uncharacterized function (DUF1469) n=1 Tax=Actinomyces bovis TaxID=1658 RepID=A0ABY1VN23_9ACTO|nr:phage holin family protein [Actinomyces bovis]SPT53519.1 Protein of uncharacterised function (DUF1469) [Actinomyces bovis]VEG55454.1 Protein of uncharacterised function (DUF1469) [Actinomyces israelii]
MLGLLRTAYASPKKAEIVSRNTTPPSPQPTLGELVARISENISGLIHGEFDLAKAKAKNMGLQMGLGTGLLVGAAAVALYGLGFLFDAAARGIGVFLPLWAGKLIVAVVLLLIAAILGLIGAKKLKEGKASMPAPQEGLKTSAKTLKSSIVSGFQKAQNHD